MKPHPWFYETVSIPALMPYLKPGLVDFNLRLWLQDEITKLEAIETGNKPAFNAAMSRQLSRDAFDRAA